jgi:hypothetical protein
MTPVDLHQLGAIGAGADRLPSEKGVGLSPVTASSAGPG